MSLTFEDYFAVAVEQWMEDNGITGELEEHYILRVKGNNYLVQTIDGSPTPTMDELRGLYNVNDLEKRDKKKKNKNKVKKNKIEVLTFEEILELDDLEEGYIVFNQDSKRLQYYNGTEWIAV